MVWAAKYQISRKLKLDVMNILCFVISELALREVELKVPFPEVHPRARVVSLLSSVIFPFSVQSFS